MKSHESKRSHNPGRKPTAAALGTLAFITVVANLPHETNSSPKTQNRAPATTAAPHVENGWRDIVITGEYPTIWSAVEQEATDSNYHGAIGNEVEAAIEHHGGKTKVEIGEHIQVPDIPDRK